MAHHGLTLNAFNLSPQSPSHTSKLSYITWKVTMASIGSLALPGYMELFQADDYLIEGMAARPDTRSWKVRCRFLVKTTPHEKWISST